MTPIKIGIVGLGKIARDQHVPVINAGKDFKLVATASRSDVSVEVPNFPDLATMLNTHPEIKAVALCMPPAPRFDIALAAIEAGKHVLLEKPPGTTVAEVEKLGEAARQKGVTLFAAWHSRYAAAVQPAKELLRDRNITAINIEWREDVEKWHPGQDWIWEEGGMGVFDPGINALSILTELVGDDITLERADLTCPPGKPMPINANLEMVLNGNIPIRACFDWRPIENEVWSVHVETDKGPISMLEGGKHLYLYGRQAQIPARSEYEAAYDHFEELIAANKSDSDSLSLQLVENALAAES
ncbi:MAG: Gfo/Idh/MocA family protein [Alphaproteobacteria bacterium]